MYVNYEEKCPKCNRPMNLVMDAVNSIMECVVCNNRIVIASPATTLNSYLIAAKTCKANSDSTGLATAITNIKAKYSIPAVNDENYNKTHREVMDVYNQMKAL